MKNSYFLSSTAVFFLLLGIVFFVGCLGGGGGGNGVSSLSEPERDNISLTVQSFMRAMVKGNKVEAQKYLSTRLQTVDSSVIASLTIWDFGKDVKDPTDDASWTLLIREGGISLLSPELSNVQAECVTPEGSLLQVTFGLIKTQGNWYIDQVALKTQTGEKFDIPSFFPMNPGDEWVYEFAGPAGESGGRVRRIIGSTTVFIDGKKVFTVYKQVESATSPGNSILRKIPPTAGIRSLFDATWTIERFSVDGGLFFFGKDPSFNANHPLTILRSEGSPGDVATYPVSFEVNGNANFADVQITLKPQEDLVTQLKTLKVLPVDIRVTYRDPLPFGFRQEREIWFLSSGIGIVGFQTFDSNDLEKPLLSTKLLEATIAGNHLLPVSETPAPTIVTVFPGDGVLNAATSTAIWADFSNDMGKESLQSAIKVLVSDAPVSGTITTLDRRVLFEPSQPFPPKTRVSVSIATSVQDANGGFLKLPGSWNFTTGGGEAPPSFTKGKDITVLEDSGVQTVSAWATGIFSGATSDNSAGLSFFLSADNAELFRGPPSISSTGVLTFTPAANGQGQSHIEVSLWNNSTQIFSASQSFLLTVTPVNDSPSFKHGSDVVSNLVIGTVVSENWSTEVSPGPADEKAQKLVFQVLNDNPGMFSIPPAVSPTGILTFSPTSIGNAHVSVSLKDNGGTASGGVDVSATQTFDITINPLVSIISPITATSTSTSASTSTSTTTSTSTSTSTATSTSTMTNASTTTDTSAATSTAAATDTATSTASTPASSTPPVPTNHPPSFEKGSDITVFVNGGPRIVSPWATLMNPGDPSESSQKITFVVTSDNPGIFSAQPAVASDGALTFTPNNVGQAVVSVSLRDDGGVLNGGIDISPVKTFTIVINPPPPAVLTWATKQPSIVKRRKAEAVAAGGAIYLMGGYNRTSGKYLKSMEKYDPEANTWVSLPNMSADRGEFAAVELNGKIYVAGGILNGVGSSTNAKVFDPGTNSWANIANLPGKRHISSGVALNGKFYVIGGRNTDSMYEYDPQTNTWTTKASMPAQKWSFAATVLNGKIYAVGGRHSESSKNNTLFEYDPQQNSWKTKTPMSKSRSGISAIALNGKMYVVGGQDSDDNILSLVEEYDPLTDTWTTKPPMPTPREDVALAADNNKIFVIGGGAGDEEATPYNVLEIGTFQTSP